MTTTQPVYLVMVTPDNHNKFYRMVPCGDNFFIAEYGRISSTPQKKKYPISAWNQKYNEKVNKGYVDQTNLHNIIVQKVTNNKYAEIDDASVRNLVDMLMSWANEVIKSSYQVVSSEVTSEMINQAQYLINKLAHYHMDVYKFNAILLELFTVIPRKMEKVVSYLANSSDDFDKIINREQEILDVMSTQVHQHHSVSENSSETTVKNKGEKTILDIMGLEIVSCSSKEEESIKKHLTAESAYMFSRAWKVINKKTEEAYRNYVEKNNIKNSKLYFHGSQNANYWNILIEGLKIMKYDVNGSMFGRGLYFAPRAAKSIRYTSLLGSTYGRGTSVTSMLAIFKVALGESIDVYDSHPFTEKEVLSKGKHSVYAHKGRSLINDEIIVYNAAAATIRYLVELKV